MNAIEFYCSEMLKATKIIAVPESKFNNTINDHVQLIKLNIRSRNDESLFKNFHLNFIQKWC